MASCRTLPTILVFLAALSAAACQSQSGPAAPNGKAGAAMLGDGSPAISVTQETAPQPRTATYNCGGGNSLTIENLGSSIHVLGSDGALDEELPASPANQNSRFGAEHDAVVIDGRDALVMKGGATPVTCKR